MDTDTTTLRGLFAKWTIIYHKVERHRCKERGSSLPMVTHEIDSSKSNSYEGRDLHRTAVCDGGWVELAAMVMHQNSR
jgi:hypothetical protein